MSDTHPTLARWYGSQKAKQETLQELKAAKDAGFKTLKDYHHAQKKAARSDGEGRDAVDDLYAEKDYPDYKGTGQKAVDFIVKQQGGQVRGAFTRPEIGDIDVVWGKVTNGEKHIGYGPAHIIDKHGMETVKKIGQIIKNEEVYRDKRNRLCIKNNNAEIALKEDWFGNKKNWIVTSYKIEERAKTITSGSNYTGEALPETSAASRPQSGEKSISIAETLSSLYKFFYLPT